tara:strand:- start:13462 stop:13845 length:384 start_codon:yes stop_codon:yes gene_type:complete
MKRQNGAGGIALAHRAMCALGLFLGVASASVFATELSDSQAGSLFNDQGCNACHGVNEIRLGPSFQIIAQRYSDATPEAVERLALKIRLGGAGAWGTVPMISYPGLSDEDARRITRWILRLNAPVSQ